MKLLTPRRKLITPPSAGDSRPTFWRKEPPALDADRRIVRGGMWPSQRAAWDLPNFIKLFVGGYGAGKTMLLCKRAIQACIVNAPVPCAIVCPTYSMAAKTVAETMVELLDGKATVCRGLTWKMHRGNFTFTIILGDRVGRIFVYSGENPARLKGANLGWAGIDEPFIQDVAVFEQMVARVRHPDATMKEVFMTGTPEELNWGYELAEGELKDRWDTGIVHASTRENLALDPAYVERLSSGFDERMKAAFVDGVFVMLSKGQVYYNFNPAEHVKKLEVPYGARWGCGMDFNVNPMSFCVFWTCRDAIHFVDEFELPNSDTREACRVLREKYPQVEEVYPDPSGRNRSTKAPGGVTDFDHIEDAGLDVLAPSAAIPLRDRENSVNSLLYTRRFSMDPRCKKLKRCYSTYTHTNRNTELGKELSHMVDASGYPIHFLFPIDAKRLRGADLRK